MTSCNKNRDRWDGILVFLLSTTVIFLSRLGTGVFGEDAGPFQYWQQGRTLSLENVLAPLTSSLTSTNLPGFRPISQWITNLLCLVIQRDVVSAATLWPWFLLNGALCGLVAFSEFRFARLFVGRWPAILAAFFLILSTPFSSPAWIFVGGTQATLYLWMATALYAYTRLAEGPRNRGLLAFWIALLITGPWVREYFIVVPAAVLAVEVLVYRRFGILAVVAALACLHGAFPAAPFLLDPIWKIGNVQSTTKSMGATGIFNIFSVKKGALMTLLNFAPSLFLLGIVGCTLTQKTKKLFLLVIAFLAFAYPACRYFVMPLYLGYCLIPGGILIAIGVSELFRRTRRKAARMGLALVLALGVADVCQTFLGIRSINRAVFRAVADMTTWVADHTQDLSPIMMNSWLCWDLQAQLNFIGRGAPCYFVTHQENRQMNSPGNASTHAELEKIVKEAARNKLHTYFIDDEFPGIHPLRSHKFVQQHSVDTVALGEIARIDVRFFRPDPLRFLIYDLRLNRTWIGVPDYILDFGFQVMPFYEVKATFSAYQVVGTNVRVVAPEDEL